jgi:hypothetical protein
VFPACFVPSYALVYAFKMPLCHHLTTVTTAAACSSPMPFISCRACSALAFRLALHYIYHMVYRLCTTHRHSLSCPSFAAYCYRIILFEFFSALLFVYIQPYSFFASFSLIFILSSVHHIGFIIYSFIRRTGGGSRACAVLLYLCRVGSIHPENYSTYLL